MKIVSVRAFPFHYRFAPENPSRYLRDRQLSFVFVRAESDTGLCGYGEVCDSFCCTYPRSMATLVEEGLEPLVKGEELAPEALTRKMREGTRRRLGDAGLVVAAISGVEIALWDLLGRAESASVRDLLGGRRSEVPVYASGTFLDEGPAEWHLKFYRPWLEQGIRTIKVRSGTDPKWDLRTLAAFRRLLDADVKILVDGGGNYRFEEALEISKALADLGVVFFEEPIPRSERQALARLVEQAPLPIAYGEHLSVTADFHDCLANRRVSIIQPDAATCGGISECLAIARLAESFGAPVVPHAAAGPVSLAANLHWAAASNVTMLEYPFPLQPVWEALLAEPVLWGSALHNGCLKVPDGPGLGLRIEEQLGNLDDHPEIASRLTNLSHQARA